MELHKQEGAVSRFKGKKVDLIVTVNGDSRKVFITESGKAYTATIKQFITGCDRFSGTGKAEFMFQIADPVFLGSNLTDSQLVEFFNS